MVELGKHRLFLRKDGIIEGVIVGAVSMDEIDALLKKTYEIGYKELEDQGKPMLLLNDLTEMDELHGDVPRFTRAALAYLDFKKMALVNPAPKYAILAKAIFTAIGKGDRLGVFKSKTEAEEWLLKK